MCASVCVCVRERESEREREMVGFFTPQLPSPQTLQSVQDKGFHMFPKQNLIHSNFKRKNYNGYKTGTKACYQTKIQQTNWGGECGRILTDRHPNTVQSDHLHQLLESQWSTE